MTLADTVNGPILTLGLVGGVLFILALVFLSGKGALLIAGYNTAPKEKCDKYDEKKMCRIVGIGLMIIAIGLISMVVFIDVLPAWFVWVFLGITLAVSITIIILLNAICKMK